MNVESILIFEPERVDLLYPFSIMHPLWEVRCGAYRIFEKLQKQFPAARLIFSGRKLHTESFLARFNMGGQDIKKENTLIYHSAILPDKEFFDSLTNGYESISRENPEIGSVIFSHNQVPVAAYMRGEDIINPGDGDKEFLPKLFDEFGLSLPHVEIPEPKVINYLWDALSYNSHAIIDDSRHFANHYDFTFGRKMGAHFINENSIMIAPNAKIHPGAVLDASDGLIIIDENVVIMPNAVIQGPCFVGNNSTVKIGAKIYKDCSFGEWCKIGGEIENSIVQSYSNKQHEGFLGHSFISEWVNLGADTNTSDLKNTYSSIKVRLGKNEFNSGRMFLGLLCGDHTKSAINTSFTTGTTAGICGIIVADGFLPNFIPSFAWRGVKGCSYYKLDKALETARIVMQRRGKELLQADEELLTNEYENVRKMYYS